LGKKVLVATSAGGHWVQMRRMLPAFDGCELVYVGVEPELDADLRPARYYRVRNVNRRDPLGFVPALRETWRLLREERPDAVVSTGAAPGLVALVMAKLLLGSRTVWVDSIANRERLSLSGRLARPVADAWLTQWPHLARPGGPHYWGAVL
jgi:exopolysaccharide biosynthesis glucuronosyltransferase PssD